MQVLRYHSSRIREKSDGLEDQIEKELIARGYCKRGTSSLVAGLAIALLILTVRL